MDKQDSTLYWIWLTQCFPIPSSKVTQILDQTDPVTFYKERTPYPFLTAQDMKTVSTISLERAQMILDDTKKAGGRVITLEDDEYPESLLTIYCPPPVLYLRGSLSCLQDRLSVAAVGSRKADNYYNIEMGNICYQLSRAGAVIISGCAVGNDTYAHSGAVAARKPTVAVLACGLDVDYPKESHRLKEQILANGGALVTELPPGRRNERGYFQARNRLIAGLADCVLLGQVPMRSGAMITANAAVDQGKDVFCIPPASISDPKCMGVAGFIRDGARLAMAAYDIASAYSGVYRETLDMEYIERHPYMFKDAQETADMTGKKAEPKSRKQSPKTSAAEEKPEVPARQQVLEELKEEDPNRYREIYERLYPERNVSVPEKEPDIKASPEKTEPVSGETDSVRKKILAFLVDGPHLIDEIGRECGLNASSLLTLLTEMELEGLIESLPGQYCALAR